MFKKLFLIFVSSTLLCKPLVHASEKEIFLTTTEYPPYYGEKLKHNGFITEVIKQVFQQKGYRVRIGFYPWLRCKMMAEKGESDGMFTLWHTVERERWFIFSEPIPPHNAIGFFKRKDMDITFSTLDDLKQYAIGSVLGYAYSLEFMNAGLIISKFYNDEKLITKLVQGRIDLAIIDRLQGRYLLKSNYLIQRDKFEFIEPPIEIRKQYLVLSKKNKNAQKIINDFNLGLKQITNDGSLNQIFNDYNLQL